MTVSQNPLTFARPMIRGLIGLNALYAIGISVLLVATFLAPNLLLRALPGLGGSDAWQLHAAMRIIMCLGLVGAYVAHRALRELLAIVDTVRDGDPFVLGNARRLQAIAWWVLAGEGLRMLIGLASGYARPLDIHIEFSFAPWLAVLLLFVLARVFDQGARMRADLEGTV